MSLVVALSVGAVLYLVAARRREGRRRVARAVAEELIPEIRSLVDTATTSSGSAARYETHRARVRELFSNEQSYAVENFYGSIEAYRRAQSTMTEAFSEADERSLGDRIRAKDQRDRCLKDVFYTGEAAIQQLERVIR